MTLYSCIKSGIWDTTVNSYCAPYSSASLMELRFTWSFNFVSETAVLTLWPRGPCHIREHEVQAIWEGAAVIDWNKLLAAVLDEPRLLPAMCQGTAMNYLLKRLPYVPTPQQPFKTPQLPSNRGHEPITIASFLGGYIFSNNTIAG